MAPTSPSKYRCATRSCSNIPSTRRSGIAGSAPTIPTSPSPAPLPPSPFSGVLGVRSCVHCLNWLIPKDLTVNGVNGSLRGHDLVRRPGDLPAGNHEVPLAVIHFNLGGVVRIPRDAAERQ